MNRDDRHVGRRPVMDRGRPRLGGPATGLVAAAVVTIVLVIALGDAAAQLCGGGDADPAGTSDTIDFPDLAPGSTRQWPMTVENTTDGPLAIEVTLEPTGEVLDALRIGLDVCIEPWTPSVGAAPATCASGARVEIPATVLDGDLEHHAPNLAPGAIWYAMFRAHLPATTGNELQGATGTVRSLVVWGDACPTTTTGPTTAVPTTAGPSTTGPGPTTSISTPRPTDAAVRPPLGPGGGSGPSSGGTPGRLPFTGAGIGSLVALAVVMTACGLVLMIRGRRAPSPPGRRLH